MGMAHVLHRGVLRDLSLRVLCEILDNATMDDNEANEDSNGIEAGRYLGRLPPMGHAKPNPLFHFLL